MEGFCRACLVKYNEPAELYPYTEKIRRLFLYSSGIQVKQSDSHTFQICKSCHVNMTMCCKFKKQCRTSDKRYQHYLSLKEVEEVYDLATYLKRNDDALRLRFPSFSGNSTPANQASKDDDNESTCTSIRNFMSDILQGEDVPETEARLIKEVIEEGIDVLDDTLDSDLLQDDNMSIDNDFSFSPYSTPRSTNIDHCYTPTKQIEPTFYKGLSETGITLSQNKDLHVDKDLLTTNNENNINNSNVTPNYFGASVNFTDNLPQIENNIRTEIGTIPKKNLELIKDYYKIQMENELAVKSIAIDLADVETNIISGNDDQVGNKQIHIISVKDEENYYQEPINEDITFKVPNSDNLQRVLKQDDEALTLNNLTSATDSHIQTCASTPTINIFNENCLKENVIVKPEVCENVEESETVIKKEVNEINIDTAYSPLEDKIAKLEERKCDICNRQFKNLKSLKTHILRYHENWNSIAKLKSNTEKIECDSIKAECKVCDSIFENVSSLNLHISMAHGSEKIGRDYRDTVKDLEVDFNLKEAHCLTCNKTFNKQSGLKKHLTMFHKIKESKTNTDSRLNKEENNITQDVEYDLNDHACKSCDRKFIDVRSLKLHLFRFHGGFRPHQDKKVDLDNVKYNLEEATCISCNRKFNSVQSLKKHLTLTHGNETESVCLICNKKFKSVKALNLHLNLSHKQKKAIRKRQIEAGEYDLKEALCKSCLMKFKDTKSLKMHLNRFHNVKLLKTRSKIYKIRRTCDVCGVTYSDYSNFKKHLLTHKDDGKKDIRCVICEINFASENKLKLHMGTHMPRETAEPNMNKKYFCSICGTYLSNSSSYSVHLRRHEKKYSFECDECGSRYYRRIDLISHVRLHTGELPFACKVCKKRFRLKPSLVCHMKTHLTEKQFNCEYCLKKFISRSNLSKHIKTSKLCKLVRAGLQPIRESRTPKYTCFYCMEIFDRKVWLVAHQKNYNPCKTMHNRGSENAEHYEELLDAERDEDIKMETLEIDEENEDVDVVNEDYEEIEVLEEKDEEVIVANDDEQCETVNVIYEEVFLED